MTYSERFNDHETRQIYHELIMSNMAHYPGSENAMFTDLLSPTDAEAPQRKPMPRLSWRSIFRFPVFGLPSLT